MADIFVAQQSILQGVSKYFYWVIVATALMIIFEITRFLSAYRAQGYAGKVEQHMIKEGVPEPQAEAEVKEEDRTGRKDKKVNKFVLKEFAELKLLHDDLKSATDVDLLGKAASKFRDLHREETVERRLDRRIRGLTTEARRLAGVEPAKRPGIEKAMAEIISANQRLKVLMGKGGEFEVIVDTQVHAGFTLEQKKAQLMAILQQAVKLEEAVYLGVKELNTLIAT